MSLRSTYWQAAWLIALGELFLLGLITSEGPVINPVLTGLSRVTAYLMLSFFGVFCPVAGVTLLWISAKKGITPFLCGLVSASLIVLSGFYSLLMLIPLSYGHVEAPMLLVPIIFIAALSLSYRHSTNAAQLATPAI